MQKINTLKEAIDVLDLSEPTEEPQVKEPILNEETKAVLDVVMSVATISAIVWGFTRYASYIVQKGVERALQSAA